MSSSKVLLLIFVVFVIVVINGHAVDRSLRRPVNREGEVVALPRQVGAPVRRDGVGVQRGEWRRIQKRRRRKRKKNAVIVQGPLTGDTSALNRSHNDPRFLSLFTVVKFANEPCVSGNGNNGTCLTSSDCSRQQGSASGSCASGFGVCCVFAVTCGHETSRNGTFFHSQGFPSTFNAIGVCQLTVNKMSEDVCQLRLDFEMFVLAQPEPVDHQCQDDQFIVSGGSQVPAICGVNSGTHIYIHLGLSTTAPTTLSVITSESEFSRAFNMKVSQIECSSITRAPDGCLQYYTGLAGRIESFNYNDAGGLQLSNTDYSICIRTERSFCSIEYDACVDDVNVEPGMSFSLTGSFDNMLGTQFGTSACTSDYLIIPCFAVPDTGSPADCQDRICGMVFGAQAITSGSPSEPITSFVKPFGIAVHTDSVEESDNREPDVLNRGFCLHFVQGPCTT